MPFSKVPVRLARLVHIKHFVDSDPEPTLQKVHDGLPVRGRGVHHRARAPPPSRPTEGQGYRPVLVCLHGENGTEEVGDGEAGRLDADALIHATRGDEAGTSGVQLPNAERVDCSGEWAEFSQTGAHVVVCGVVHDLWSDLVWWSRTYLVGSEVKYSVTL